MTQTIDVLFTPAEFEAAGRRDLSTTVCVVFDILRATTTMMTALAHGASALIPVREIADAVALRRENPRLLLAGERDGLRIRAAQSGGIDFDLGNSPREFTRDVVQDKTIAITTTNGTRALQACRGAQAVLIGSFLNLRPLAEWLRREPPSHLLLVCSGTHEEAAYEDTLAAGALGELLASAHGAGQGSDAVAIARQVYRAAQPDLLGALQQSRNARRLMTMPDLRDDVAWCVTGTPLELLAALHADGRVRRFEPHPGA